MLESDFPCPAQAQKRHTLTMPYYQRNNSLTHHRYLVKWSEFLIGLLAWDEVAQADGAKGDEAEIKSFQKGPRALDDAKNNSWHHKEQHDDQQEQEDKVHGAGSLRTPAEPPTPRRHRTEVQRHHEAMHTCRQHQHGERDAK